MAQARRTGKVTAKPQGGDRRSRAIEAQANPILALIAARPDSTLKELKAVLAADEHVFSVSALSRFFQRQKTTAHAAEQERPDVVKKREDWAGGQLAFDPDRLIFIDETSASTKWRVPRGRTPRGERLRASIPHGHWKTTTFVAGLRLSGMVAPMVLDGPINGAVFQAYADHVLVPDLQQGDIVVMDNLGSHKGASVRAAIEAAGAKLHYLPPYSPDFNPIENAFSKLKALLPPSVPSKACGLPSDVASTALRRANAPTTSEPPDTSQLDRELL
ncbi:transposase [Bradyrhizobium sp. ERR14]|nr:transposase [Bradyrhizobium sp. ERR14]